MKRREAAFCSYNRGNGALLIGKALCALFVSGSLVISGNAQETDSSSNAVVQLVSPVKPGIIHIELNSFAYANDPSGTDIMSHDSLGDASLFKVRLFPQGFLQSDIYGIKEYEKLAGMGLAQPVMAHTENQRKIGMSSVARPKALTDVDAKNGVMQILKDNHPLFISIDPSIPYIDIPVPPGVYYLDYSVYFPSAKNDQFHSLHMNYLNAQTAKWGPTKVEVTAGDVVEIEFKPTNAANGYNDSGDDTDFINGSPAYKDFLHYILNTGQD
jgi:hypothetical protein